MKQDVSYCSMVNKTYKEFQSKLNKCFNLIEDCFGISKKFMMRLKISMR